MFFDNGFNPCKQRPKAGKINRTGLRLNDFVGECALSVVHRRIEVVGRTERLPIQLDRFRCGIERILDGVLEHLESIRRAIDS